MVPSTVNTQVCFLWCMGTIYFFAFSSLYFQIPGLYGNNGILPAHLQLKEDICGDNNEKCNYWESIGECENNPSWMLKNCRLSCKICKEGDVTPLSEQLMNKPTLLWLSKFVGLDVETGMELICLMGACISLSILLFAWCRNAVVFFALWALYFSVYQVGQTFLWFQWDILLLETGFITIFLAPFKSPRDVKSSDPCHSVVFWLLKWLLFRLMFTSGVVKLTSMCPTWWGLTALDWHYESQCIPTPLAWYAHQLPEWIQRLSVVATYVIEIGLPFLFFSPVRLLRLLSFYSQVLLQVLIILTGNYNFFNWLTLALCLALLDDKHLKLFIPQKYLISEYEDTPKSSQRWVKVKKYLPLLLFVLVTSALCYWTKILFNIHLSKDFLIESSIAFSEKGFLEFVHKRTRAGIALGLIKLVIRILVVLYRSYSSHRGITTKIWRLIKTFFYSIITVWLFCISLVPYTKIDSTTQGDIYPVIHKWYSAADKFQIANSYGLFRRMTGVGGRPELIIEGTNDLNGQWKEYNFHFKPGNVSERLPIVAPHQPRLDWQMWFAALGSYQHNPWFIHLIDKLLIGEPHVLSLLGHNPFPSKPPKYIRSILYKYHYTTLPKNTSGILDAISKSRKIKNWWKRDSAKEYTYTLTKDDPSLKKFISDMGWNEHPSEELTKGFLYQFILQLRDIVHGVHPTVTMMQIWLLTVFSWFLKCVFA